MELLTFPTDNFQTFLICTARISALISAIPVFSGAMIPAKLRVILALAFSILLFPQMEAYVPTEPLAPISLALLIANEALLGFMVGMLARLIFTAAEFGGTIIGYQMGFAAANVFDPQSQRQTSLMSQFQNVFAILIFLALDMHHLFIRAIVESYQVLPPGYLNFSGEAIPFLMRMAGEMFLLGVKFTAPVLAVLLLSGLVLGIMARVFPQLNVFILSFPLNIGLAFLVIGLTLNIVANILQSEFAALGDRFMTLFQLL